MRMKGFVEGITKSVTNLERTFEETVRTGVIRPDSTEADSSVWEKVVKAAQDTDATARDAARKEWREHVLKSLEDSGMSKEEAEKWFFDRWNTVKSLADEGIQYAPKIGLAAKATALAIFAAVTALVGTVLSGGAFNSGQQTRQWSNEFDRRMDQVRYQDQLTMNQQEFMQMGTLLSPSANIPAAAFQPPAIAAVPRAVAVEPEVALPASVAAVADNPVQVEIVNNGSTYTGQTTVRQFYRAVPQARPQIQWHIDHGYDHPEWYRLDTQPLGNWRNSPAHHVNIDINAGFASAHFHM